MFKETENNNEQNKTNNRNKNKKQKRERERERERERGGGGGKRRRNPTIHSQPPPPIYSWFNAQSITTITVTSEKRGREQKRQKDKANCIFSDQQHPQPITLQAPLTSEHVLRTGHSTSLNRETPPPSLGAYLPGQTA